MRDFKLRNTAASAAIPTNFASLANLRHLTLTYNNAAIAMPTTTLTSGGNLDVTAGGAITQSGAITVPGTASFNAGANAITLTTAGNNFTGAVSITNPGSNAVDITDANDLTLGALNIAAGNLTRSVSMTLHHR